MDSVVRAVGEVGGTAYAVQRGEDLDDPDRIILPGVGSFAAATERLRADGLAEAVVARAVDGVPLLGICLGMQLLATSGDEGGGAAGLGLIAGHVQRFEPATPDERVPHVGWNQVDPVASCALFEGVEPGTDFYFVHGYHFVAASESSVVATTPYCGGFTSAVASGNVYGVQFHPEKSHRAGLRVLRNFVEIRC